MHLYRTAGNGNKKNAFGMDDAENLSTSEKSTKQTVKKSTMTQTDNVEPLKPESKDSGVKKLTSPDGQFPNLFSTYREAPKNLNCVRPFS